MQDGSARMGDEQTVWRPPVAGPLRSIVPPPDLTFARVNVPLSIVNAFAHDRFSGTPVAVLLLRGAAARSHDGHRGGRGVP
jgi:hypothetical protein